eukprot:TRINITY_DN74331_c0_g1_i1.p1 TRINITY_DN74331_c0_g1~~TRINITY_DN74331_c0_g1_i1.p1  ORF type:complete len:213 (+),score=30.52 TRINITY_DN74331_c0_g1_i1:189-827(+)
MFELRHDVVLQCKRQAGGGVLMKKCIVIASALLLVIHRLHHTYSSRRVFIVPVVQDTSSAGRVISHPHCRTHTLARLAEQGPGQIKVLLTAEEKGQLKDLGYMEEEIATMRVELAMAVIEKGTRRPWGTSPMPESWQDEFAILATSEVTGEEVETGKARNFRNEGDVTINITTGQILALAAMTLALVYVTVTPPSADRVYGSLPEYSLRSSQ